MESRAGCAIRKTSHRASSLPCAEDRGRVLTGWSMRRIPATGSDAAAAAHLVRKRHPVQKRSLTLSGHRTSLALEPEFWAALEGIAVRRGVSLPALIGEIDTLRPRARGLASAARVFALLNLDHSPPVLEG